MSASPIVNLALRLPYLQRKCERRDTRPEISVRALGVLGRWGWVLEKATESELCLRLRKRQERPASVTRRCLKVAIGAVIEYGSTKYLIR